MQRMLWRMSALTLGLMLVCAGVVWADHDAPDNSGNRAPEQQETDDAQEGYGPMMYHLQGMMQNMRGMMHGLEGMMGSGRRMQADDDDDEMPWGGMMGRGMMGRYGRGHGYRLMRHMERVMDDLDLSDQQKQKIRERLFDHMKQAIKIRAELATERVDLMEALDADKVDMTKVKDLLQGIATRRADLRFARLSLMQEIKQQLTPEQLKKFKAEGGHMMWGYGRKLDTDWMAHGRRHRYGREMGYGRGMGPGMGQGRGMGPGMGQGRGMGMGPGGMRNPSGTQQQPEKQR